MQAHLAALFALEDTQHEQQEASGDGADMPQTDATAPVAIGPVPLPMPVVLSEAEQEELATQNAARYDWIAEEGRQQREVHGLYQRTADFKVSTTDPDATPMRLKGGGTHLGYHVHYVVDGGKARVILQVLVTPSEVMDNQPMRDLIFRVRFRWKLRLAAGQNLKRLLKKRGWGRRPFPTEALCASFWGLLREVRVLVLEKCSFLALIGSASSMVRTQCFSVC
jgi:hypothetical protein